ncbi:MAG: DUF5615 family PIN-like protein [Candidatus Poribacteria bacterium]
MIALYIDENIPEAITNGLRMRDVDVITTQDDGLSGELDITILDRAGELDRVLVTHDKHFLQESSKRMRKNIYFYGIIYVDKHKYLSNREYIDDLELIAKASDSTYFEERKVERLPF